MKLSSKVFGNNQPIPRRYTCDGENVSPPLKIENIPGATKSLALVVDDPDSPSGNFLHWIIWNVSSTTTTLREGDGPANATQGINDFGKVGYGGPCPNSGEHRYKFRLYALDAYLDTSPSSSRKDIEAAMRGHVLEEAELSGSYKRE